MSGADHHERGGSQVPHPQHRPRARPGARTRALLRRRDHHGAGRAAQETQSRLQVSSHVKLLGNFKPILIIFRPHIMGEENHNLCCVFFQILPNLHDLRPLLNYFI